MFKERKHDPAIVRAFREQRGWTHEQMADEVWASPVEVAAWEAGTVRLPGQQAAAIRRLVAEDRRRAAIVAAGLPRCAWADANMPHLHELLCMEPSRVDDHLAAQRHLGECPTCVHVYAFGRKLRVAPPDLRLGSEPVDLRRWLTTAGVAVVVVVAVAMLNRFHGDRDESWLDPFYLGLVFFFITAEFVADFVAAFSRSKPYAAGLVTGAVGVFAGLLVWSGIHPGQDLSDPVVLSVAAALALVVGVLKGRWNAWRAWEDDDGGAREPERGLAPVADALLLRDGGIDFDLARTEPADRIAHPRSSD